MKKQLVQTAIFLMAAVMICLGCFAEGDPETRTAESARTIAVLLPSYDGFKSVPVDEKALSLTDALDIFIAAAEEMGHNIVLQGATKDNDLSELRYRTADRLTAVDWSKLKTLRSDEMQILGRTCNLLTRDGYNTYDQLVVISGKLNPSTKGANPKLKKAAVPTCLFQLVPFDAGANSLFDLFAKIAGLNVDESVETDTDGYSVYRVSDNNGNHSEIIYKEYESFNTDSFLNELLSKTLFDGYFDIPSSTFSLPTSFIDDSWMIVTGDDLTDLAIVTSDGTKLAVVPQEDGQRNYLKCRMLNRNNKQIKIFPLKEVLSSQQLELENGGKDLSAKLFYFEKEAINSMLRDIKLIDDGALEKHCKKGSHTFDMVDTAIIRDLMTLYPTLRLSVSDTIGEVTKESVTAEENSPTKVTVKFQESGEHTLLFRLMNGENELISQMVSIKVEDQGLEPMQNDGETIVVHPDLNDTLVWSVEDWFNDPDESDIISIKKISDNDGRISFSEENKQVSLVLDNSMSDGSEDVYLQASSDTSTERGSITITWRYLAPQLNNLEISKCDIIPVKQDDPLTKRTKVYLYAKVNNAGEDQDLILQQLIACKAIVMDDDDNKVADATFDPEKMEFKSDTFALPDQSGKYRWTIRLGSGEDSILQWSCSERTGRVSIENHAPIADTTALGDDYFEEEILSDPKAWDMIPEKELFTDPDGDPVNITMSIEKEGVTTEYKYNQGETVSLEDFGEYTITFTACDNEGVSSVTNIVKYVTLINLFEKLNRVEGTLTSNSEEDNQSINSQFELVFQLNSKDWKDEEKEKYTEWLSNCSVTVFQNDQVLSDVDAVYDKNTQSFTTKINTPGNQGDYSYRVVLSNQTEDEEKVKITSKEPCIVHAENQIPFSNPDVALDDIDSWVIAAEDQQLTIPANAIIDNNDDIVSYHIKVVNMEDSDNPLRDEDVILPVDISFEPFSATQMTSNYEITITATDNDKQSGDRVFRVTLKNKKLLYILIGIATLVLLIIVAVVVYIIHRKRMPSFAGEICFQYHGKDVSRAIDLSPWKKQKRIPLQIFAGAINILLTDAQWDELNNFELRPDKENGYKLYQKKSAIPEETSCIGELNINQAVRVERESNEEKTDESNQRSRT